MEKINEQAKRLYGLDHLRAFAICFVFLYHYGQLFPHPSWANRIGKFGWTGVDLFFVLSGYLIASQLFSTIAGGKRLALPEYFIKRFFRIIPAYLVVLAIYFFIPYAREWEGLAPAWKYLTFTQNIGLNLSTQKTFSHVWSLCIEEQFYLILPLLLAVLIRFNQVSKGFLILAGLFIAGFFIRWYCYDTLVEPFFDTNQGLLKWYKWIYYPTFSRLDGLIAGVSVAALFGFRPVWKERLLTYGNSWLFLAIALLTGAYFLCEEQSSFEATVFGFPLVAIGYTALLLAALSPSGILYKLSSRVTATIATLSYAIYLSHKITVHITQDQFGKMGFDIHGSGMFVLCVISSVAAAWVLNKLVEQPFMKWRKQLLAKKTISS